MACWCWDHRKDFSPLVYSVDGMTGPETRAAEKRLAEKLSKKWKRDYSELCGYVRACMSIVVVRANTLMHCGQRAKRRPYHPLIEYGDAMDAWQTWSEPW